MIATTKSLKSILGLGLALGASAGLAFAATTGTTHLHMQQGAGAATSVGDYISADTLGLNTYYSFFIEVPPGLSRLDVDIFDADWGAGGGAEALAGRDRARNTTFDSTATFSLLNPNGVAQALNFTTSSATLPAGGDNTWLNLFSSTPTSTAPTFVAAATALGNGVTSLGLSVPAGTAADDLLIAAITRDLDGTSTSVTAPGGWTLLDQGNCATAVCHLALFYQVVTTVPSSPQTFTWTGNQRAAGAMFTFRGVDITTPFDVTLATATGASTNPVAPSVTTVTPNTLILRIFGGGPSVSGAVSPPASHTERWDQGQGGGAGASQASGAAATIVQASAGASGSATFTAATNRWRAATIALRAAPAVVRAGHWELRIDSDNAGNDINALGVRAHDGNSGSGGAEIPVYADSFFSYGVNTEEAGATSTRTYTQYPWITEGCRLEFNSFDWDSDSGATGSATLTSRASAFTQTITTLSSNNLWGNVNLNAFTTSANSTEYGTWTSAFSIQEYVNDQGDNANYGVVYLGDDGLADPPPTSQPVPDAFRIYLPTDAGAAPPKPYLEQQLRWSCGGSGLPSFGPNPPQIGQTSCFTVTVRLVNPTSRSITFSSPTNVVTATVPGAGVVYAGGAGGSQGTVTSAPAIGGTGDIVWNPGTVAAGTTQLLTYWVNVTPVAAGTIVVTATHASGNGTRARYVDETGNTTQTRATYELGPLCELAASTTSATPAVVFGLAAAPAAGGVAVRWETASEVGSSRFELHRLAAGGKRWTRVDDGRLVAGAFAFQGNIYRALDRGADPAAVQTYAVVEVEFDGSRRTHGPFVVKPAAQAWEASGGEPPVEPRALSTPRAAIEEEAVAVAPASGLKVGVRAAGLVLVAADQLANGLGMPLDEVTSRLTGQGFALSREGGPVAWMPAAGGAGLLFFGEGVESPYSSEAVYLLRPGRGRALEAGSGRPGAFDPLPFVEGTAVAEEDRLAAMVLAADPESDYWYWQALVATDPGAAQASFTLAAPRALEGRSATLRVTLAGASPAASGEHRVQVAMNGTALGEIAFSGLERHEAAFAVPRGVVLAGDNTVELTASLAPGGTENDLFVDAFALDHLRLPVADGDAFESATTGRVTLAVSEFADPRIQVFDLADPFAPRLLKEAVVTPGSGRYTVTFASSARRGRYLAVSPAGWRSPAWVRPDFPSALRGAGNGAEYLVIAPHALVGPAENLAALREDQGLVAAVVDLDDIYDEFADGFPTPHAIRAFLAHATAQWSPVPRFVVLAGNGDFDYRGLLGYGGNLLPPLMVATADGLFASDARLADVAGDDGIPDLAIGRLPVRNAAELAAVVAKIAAFEAAGVSSGGRALLVADDAEAGFDFAADLDTFQGWLPIGFVPERIALTPGELAGARAALFAGLEAGADLLLFSGHAGLDRLTAEGLLTSADLSTLPTSALSPLVVAVTCVMNRFELPMLAPLGAGLVTAPGAGAVGVWSATGLSTHPAAPRLVRYFLDEMGRNPGARVGEPMLAAQARFAQTEGVELLSVYNLLGDPATRLAAPVPLPPTPPAPGGDLE